MYICFCNLEAKEYYLLTLSNKISSLVDGPFSNFKIFKIWKRLANSVFIEVTWKEKLEHSIFHKKCFAIVWKSCSETIGSLRIRMNFRKLQLYKNLCLRNYLWFDKHQSHYGKCEFHMIIYNNISAFGNFSHTQSITISGSYLRIHNFEDNFLHMIQHYHV